MYFPTWEPSSFYGAADAPQGLNSGLANILASLGPQLGP